jgi:hypothetical protein
VQRLGLVAGEDFSSSGIHAGDGQRRFEPAVPERPNAFRRVQPKHAAPVVPMTDLEENCTVTQASKPRSTNSPVPKKLAHPAKEFSDPAAVVADSALSTKEKRVALSSLEQDARQLAVASAEGMGGGEETGLRDVLETERSLDESSADAAFNVVLRTFTEQLQATRGTDAHGLVNRAIEAINAARAAIATHNVAAQGTPPGAPEPGSAAELQEELDKEKLDPGS